MPKPKLIDTLIINDKSGMKGVTVISISARYERRREKVTITL